MPRGAKSRFTDRQDRKADHIAAGYEKRGVCEKAAERRAWRTQGRRGLRRSRAGRSVGGGEEGLGNAAAQGRTLRSPTMDREQSPGRDENAAIPGGKPDASTSDEAVKRTGERERRPDGPDATEVGDAFKTPPGGPA